jgi:signal transduction histidine kinase
LPDGPALALLAVSTVTVGERKIYVVGGERLGKEFLASLVLPNGMRALLYTNLNANFSPQDLTDLNGTLSQAEKFAPLIDEERAHPRELTELVKWTGDKASAESFHAWPLLGRQKELLGVLLVGSSRRALVVMERWIFSLALAVAVGSVFFGILLSLWASARISRPVQKLAEAAREVAAGRWNTHVDARSGDEIGELARSFNKMTEQLSEQRDRLLQAERVAAWREVARRLAHELKNPLFPLQITVENLQRARDQNPDQFDEVFRESTTTLLAELENLKTIIGRFSDFARMPAPELRPVNLNEIARGVVKLFEAQFSAVGRPQITPEMYLDEKMPVIHADASLLHRAVENLVLNAMDAMPAGGTLTLRSGHDDGMVRLDISDSGSGLTREECERLFTPYYTTKQHGTGLGLAIVQSVVSDHGGTIAVESEPGSGTTFRIELPDRPPVHLIQPPAAPPKRPVPAEV